MVARPDKLFDDIHMYISPLEISITSERSFWINISRFRYTSRIDMFRRRVDTLYPAMAISGPLMIVVGHVCDPYLA